MRGNAKNRQIGETVSVLNGNEEAWAALRTKGIILPPILRVLHNDLG